MDGASGFTIALRLEFMEDDRGWGFGCGGSKGECGSFGAELSPVR